MQKDEYIENTLRAQIANKRLEYLYLIVLNETKMPAILIEYGFISNEAEEKLLLTDEYQETMVNSIVNGIEKYFSYNLGNK